MACRRGVGGALDRGRGEGDHCGVCDLECDDDVSDDLACLMIMNVSGMLASPLLDSHWVDECESE
jgi:hypothetical protein